MDPREASDPAAAGRRAQLVLALLFLTVLPIFILTHPLPTHVVWLDLTPAAEEPPPPLPAAVAGGEFRLLSTMVLPELPPDEPRRIHKLVLTADGRVVLDGTALDLLGLSRRLNLIEVEDEWVSFEPEPDARYELFAETLAVAKRARIERLQVPSSRFAGAIDGID